jgi:hypothetical protein
LVGQRPLTQKFNSSPQENKENEENKKIAGVRLPSKPDPHCANSGCEQSQQKKLLDHLVGGDKQPRWHGQVERTLGDWSSN